MKAKASEYEKKRKLAVNIILKDDDLREFEKLKKHLGLVHNTEVVRIALYLSNAHIRINPLLSCES